MWTVERVAARFEEAVHTAQHLPPVRVQGYVSSWPALRREAWARHARDEACPPRLTPTPQALDRLDQVLTWVCWLDESQRHVVWLRAQDYSWRTICQRTGCDRTTAWRRWQRALQQLVDILNASPRDRRVRTHR